VKLFGNEQKNIVSHTVQKGTEMQQPRMREREKGVSVLQGPPLSRARRRPLPSPPKGRSLTGGAAPLLVAAVSVAAAAATASMTEDEEAAIVAPSHAGNSSSTRRWRRRGKDGGGGGRGRRALPAG